MDAASNRSFLAAATFAALVGALVGAAGARAAARLAAERQVEALELPALDRLVARLSADARAAGR